MTRFRMDNSATRRPIAAGGRTWGRSVRLAVGGLLLLAAGLTDATPLERTPITVDPAWTPALGGSLTSAGRLPDGILVRWQRPARALLALEEPGLPPVLVDTATVELPAGMAGSVEILDVEFTVRTGVDRAPASEQLVESGHPVDEWSHASGPDGVGADGLASDGTAAGPLPSRRLRYGDGWTGRDRWAGHDALRADASGGWRRGVPTVRAVAPAPEVYDSENLFPGRLVEFRPAEQARDARFLQLLIYPEQFSGGRRELTVVSSLLLAVHWQPLEGDATGADPLTRASGDAGDVSATGGVSASTVGSPMGFDLQAFGGIPFLKMTVQADGLHEITHTDLTAAALVSAGFDVSAVDATTMHVLIGGAPILLP